METVDAKTAQPTENPHGVKASMLYNTENAQVVHITLKPGEALKKHKTPVDVFFYVLDCKAFHSKEGTTFFGM